MLKTIIRNLLKPLSFLPAILLMYMIFSFSAQDGTSSAQLSYKVSYKIVEVAGEVLGADFEPWEIESLANRFHGPVRKIAHMTEYFALAVSVAFPLYVYGLRGILLMIVAGLFCVGFACADEYHQSMVAGRSPSEKDVMIDSIGIFFGIIFTRIIGWTGRKTIFRPLAKKSKKEKKGKKNQQEFAEQTPNNYQNPPYMNYNGQPAPGYYQPQGYPNQQPYGQASYAGQPNPNYAGQARPGYAGQQMQGYNGQSYTGQPMPGYGGRPPQGYQNQQPYYNNQGAPGYAGQRGPSYYGPPPYDFPPQKQAQREDHTSDQLSEDMSFKKLMTDLKDKKQTERYLAHKPKLGKSDMDLDTEERMTSLSEEDDDELEITEINLDD